MIRWLLAPFSWLYGLVTRLRNHLYDTGYFSSHSFDRFVVSVGNLNVGGSGKTPMVEHLVGLLNRQHRVAVLSRGYGRKTRGFRPVTDADTPETAGDEPLQMHKKFGLQAAVFVAEERALAIPEILAREPDTSVIILDDAFQHRSVKPQLSVLVTDFQLPFFADYILPMGRLREAQSGARRADVVVVTKCDENVARYRQAYTTAIQKRAGACPVLFAGIRYLPPVGFAAEAYGHQPVVAVTGIANHTHFIQHLKKQYRLVKHFVYPDHHLFSEAELRTWCDFAHTLGEQAAIFTTEKDFIRLQTLYSTGGFQSIPCFYIPIKMEFFDEDGKVFDTLVVNQINHPPA